MKLHLVALLAGLIFAAEAQAARKITIQSSHDTFDVVIQSKTKGTVDGKTANMLAFTDLWPVFDNPMTNDCPQLKGSPDVTIKENGKTRSIYVKQQLVTDGKACLDVGGDGFYFFPVHRDFLIGKNRDSIQLKAPLKIFRQGVKVLELRKEGDNWVNDNKQQLLNWDFIERFENTLRDFDVRLRVHADIAKGKSKMIVQSGSQTFEFYKVTNVMWAVKKPGYPWLEASDDFSYWQDFDQNLLEDRYAAEIRLLEQAGVAPEQRKAALDKLEGVWSENLRNLYHKIVLDPAEDEYFQTTSLNRLKRKPSLSTAGVAVKFLAQSTNEDLKRTAGQILKTYYPKGPLYKPSMSSAEKSKTLEFWNKWWNQNQKGR